MLLELAMSADTDRVTSSDSTYKSGKEREPKVEVKKVAQVERATGQGAQGTRFKMPSQTPTAKLCTV